jgi:orotate phosphoribosyltransferase
LLWEIGAIKVNLDDPFKLVSGNFSPIYINCRLVLSEPSFMQLFAGFAKIICERNGILFNLVAGGETAGIPFAAYIAQSQSLPMIYVRKKAKGYGIASQVEGTIHEGQRVLLVEDLITDAGSKINFINAIRAAGGVVEDTLVLFDRLQGGRELLEEVGVRLHIITNMDEVLGAGREAEFLSAENLKAVQDYFQDPSLWHKNRGIPFID